MVTESPKKTSKKATTRATKSSGADATKKKSPVKAQEKKNTSSDSTAVIETGGKQYVVHEGDIISVEKLQGGEGDTVSFGVVLLKGNDTSVEVGTPHIKSAKVTGSILETAKGKKVSVIRFRSKSRHFKNRGHRQIYTKVKIESIS